MQLQIPEVGRPQDGTLHLVPSRGRTLLSIMFLASLGKCGTQLDPSIVFARLTLALLLVGQCGGGVCSWLVTSQPFWLILHAAWFPRLPHPLSRWSQKEEPNLVPRPAPFSVAQIRRSCVGTRLGSACFQLRERLRGRGCRRERGERYFKRHMTILGVVQVLVHGFGSVCCL